MAEAVQIALNDVYLDSWVLILDVAFAIVAFTLIRRVIK